MACAFYFPLLHLQQQREVPKASTSIAPLPEPGTCKEPAIGALPFAQSLSIFSRGSSVTTAPREVPHAPKPEQSNGGQGISCPDDEPSAFYKAWSTATVLAVGSLGKVLLNVFNRTFILEREKLMRLVEYRETGRPLLTVCNHMSFMDDPVLMSTILTYPVLASYKNLRWGLCADDVCFENPLIGAFFRTGKVLSIKRGGGLEQQEMQVAIRKLAKGDWVHIFPEGRIYQTGLVGHIKRGVGKLVTSMPEPPLVVPFYHMGMQDVLPLESFVPRIGKQVWVVIGDPIPMEDLIQKHRELGSPRVVLYDAIAARIEEELNRLRLRCIEFRSRTLAES